MSCDFIIHFNKDITKDDNLIILPVGMKLPFDPIDYLKQDYGSAQMISLIASYNQFVNLTNRASKRALLSALMFLLTGYAIQKMPISLPLLRIVRRQFC